MKTNADICYKIMTWNSTYLSTH